MKGKRGILVAVAAMAVGLIFSTFVFAAREVQVDMLWAGGEGPSTTGGTGLAIVGVESNPRKTIRGGFYEEIAGGSGIMWRTSGWMATSLTSLLLGIDLPQYRISFDVGGKLDGPSAGGLLTVALIANLFGDTVKPETTMTGQINPDGTIGPVGGIPQKIDGAAKKAKKLVLVPYGQRPYGQRSDKDLRTDQLVDVIDRGKHLGVEAREVSHISEAYPLLTGKPLPRAKLTSDLTPDLPATAQAKIQNRALMLINKYSASLSKVKAAGQLIEELKSLMDQAARAQSLGVKAYNQGLYAVAYDRMATANLMVEAVLMGVEIMRTAQEGGDQGLKSYFDSLKTVSGKIDGFVKRLDMENPKTLSDAAALSEAYGMATQAKGSYFLGLMREAEMEQLVKKATETEKKSPPPQPDQFGKRPQLGIQIADTQYGVMVSGVMRGSSAERAGLLTGDLIVQYNGYPVPHSQVFLQMIAATQPGQPITLLAVRSGQYLQLTTTLEAGASPEQPAIDPKMREMIGQKLFEAAFYYRIANFLVDLAEDRLVVGTGFPGTSLPSPGVVTQQAKLLKTSADAAMNYIDSVCLQQAANQLATNLEGFRWRFMAVEPEYTLAYATHQALEKKFIHSSSPYAIRGPSMLLDSGVSSLLAKYDSLGGAETDNLGVTKKVKYDKALVNMLDLGFKHAREGINLAQQSGVEPIIPLLCYEAAKFLREEDIEARTLAYMVGGVQLDRPALGQPGQKAPVPKTPGRK